MNCVLFAEDEGNDSFWHTELASPVSEEHRLLSNYRDPPGVQVEPSSEYLDCLLEFGELKFPLDLTLKL